jgi:hypothetical protein
MRRLYTLVLLICCFAAAMQTQAAGAPLKKPFAGAEYQAAGQSVPGDALNNYHQLTATVTIAVNPAKESAVYFNQLTYSNHTVDILSEGLQNTLAFFNGYHATIFRLKLIFPQHYHW